MSIWTCGIKAFGRKRKDDMSAKDKDLIAKRMKNLLMIGILVNLEM